MIPRFLIVLFLAVLTVSAAPITSGTIFLSPNIITASSAGTFSGLVYTGIGERLMFDRRVNAFTRYNAFLFNADYTDGFTIEIQVNPEFATAEAAQQEAEKYAPVIGQLPAALRTNVSTVWIHRGVQPFGGGNNNLLIHTGQADLYTADGILEETLVHEASHTSLDAVHSNSPGWRAAQTNDADFISTYAQDFPDREDIAESFLPYLAITWRTEALRPELADAIRRTIPNRLSYFAAQPLNMFPLSIPPLPNGAAMNISTPASGALRLGFGAILDGGIPAYGIAVISISQNGAVISEAGVPASPPLQRARIFVDYRSGVPSGIGAIDTNTGIAIARMGSAPARLTFTLRDTQGGMVATGQGGLAAGAHVAKFLHELKDIAPNFLLPGSFPTVTQFGSLEIESDQPLSITALRLTVNQRGETLLSTTPIADMNQPRDSGPFYFPQLADGGGYTTSVVLLNTTSTPQAGTFSIFNDDGAPVSVRSRSGATASTFPYAIPAGGTFVFETDGSPIDVRTGWIEFLPTHGLAPVGAGLFTYSPGGILVTESGIPSTHSTTRARVYVDQSAQHDTGIALANPQLTENTVIVQAFEKDGVTPVGSPQTVAVPARGHTAKFAGQMISGLPAEFTGILELSSNTPFAALTLRSLINIRGDFLLTTFPVADATRPAPSPVVFPQIASGGGYVTEFILINVSGSTSSVGLSLHADDRRPMSILPVAR